MQPKKQLKVQYIGIFEEIDSFIDQKCTSKKRAKNSGMGRPPPPYSGNARKKTFFFQLISSLRISKIIKVKAWILFNC